MGDEDLLISEATERLFEERRNFIIIGLTGRTGSGCSTIANLLNCDFDGLNIPKPITHDFNSNEEREYNIIYNYISKNWTRFEVIRMRDIITSFILENSIDKFHDFLDKGFDKGLEWVNGIKSEITKDQFKKQYNILHEKRIEIMNKVKENENELKSDDVHKFYFDELPKYTNSLKEFFNEYEVNAYTRIYQIIADNIRTSGESFNKKFVPENIFKFAQRTNLLIKILRKRNINLNQKVCVVIDSFRNFNEINFFKDRYSAFYLFAVNTENQHRIKRLKELGFKDNDIQQLNDKEYPDESGKQKNKIADFAFQNIQRCLEIADVYLYNPDDEYGLPDSLKREIMKYISLIIHPGLVTPTHIERCMQIAYNAKVNSGCLSRQVGTVVTNKEFAIKSVGWNDTASGQVPCNLRCISYLEQGEDVKAFSEYENNNKEFLEHIKKYKVQELAKRTELKGRLLPYCFKDVYNSFKNQKNQVYTRSLHAEENAFLQISKYGGISLNGGYLFTTASPCELCAKKAYQIGISEIYYIDPYPGIAMDNILNSGINRPKMKLFYGAIGRAYTQLYTPIIPYKDEIKMLIGVDFKDKI